MPACEWRRRAFWLVRLINGEIFIHIFSRSATKLPLFEDTSATGNCLLMLGGDLRIHLKSSGSQLRFRCWRFSAETNNQTFKRLRLCRSQELMVHVCFWSLPSARSEAKEDWRESRNLFVLQVVPAVGGDSSFHVLFLLFLLFAYFNASPWTASSPGAAGAGSLTAPDREWCLLAASSLLYYILFYFIFLKYQAKIHLLSICELDQRQDEQRSACRTAVSLRAAPRWI